MSFYEALGYATHDVISLGRRLEHDTPYSAAPKGRIAGTRPSRRWGRCNNRACGSGDSRTRADESCQARRDSPQDHRAGAAATAGRHSTGPGDGVCLWKNGVVTRALEWQFDYPVRYEIVPQERIDRSGGMTAYSYPAAGIVPPFQEMADGPILEVRPAHGPAWVGVFYGGQYKYPAAARTPCHSL